MGFLHKRTMRFAAMTAVIFAATTAAAFTAAAQGGTDSAPTRAQELAASSVATVKTPSASVSEEAQVGICVKTVSGKVLADDGAEKNFMPASNLKLVTCGAALESLGADFRFRTEIAYSGKVGDDGVLLGDLHIVGGGDPTLGSSDPNAVPRDSLFARWTRAVKAAGIRSIAGSVVGDSRRMRADVNGSWMYEDMATYYGASCSALMFNRNCLELHLRPGEAEGTPVHVGGGAEEHRENCSDRISGRCSGNGFGQEQGGCGFDESVQEPGGYGFDGSGQTILTAADAPWMKIENRCVTGPAGSGDRSYLFVSEFSPAARLGGAFALDRNGGKGNGGKTGSKTGSKGKTYSAGKTVSYNNPFADFSCAYGFALHLAAEGIPCKAVTATSPCHPTATFPDAYRSPADSSSITNPAAISGCVESAIASDTGAVFGFEVFDTEGSLTYSGHFTSQDSLTTIAVTYSPRLSEIVRETLRVSDNLYAETLLRALTLSDSSNPHFSSGTEEALESLKAILGNLGVDLSRTRLDDGSGLSRKNSLSPAFIVSFLTAMSSRPCFNEFLNAMNTPGPDEILFNTADSAKRRRIRLKSGSMTGVRCYSGYILPSSSGISSPRTSSPDTAGNSASTAGSTPQSASKPLRNDGMTVFSIMINDSTSPQSKLREHIELLLRPHLK